MNRADLKKCIAAIDKEEPDYLIRNIFSDDDNMDAIFHLHTNGYFWFCDSEEKVFIPVNIDAVEEMFFRKTCEYSFIPTDLAVALSDDEISESELIRMLDYYEIEISYRSERMTKSFFINFLDDEFLFDGKGMSVKFEEQYFTDIREFASYLQNQRYLQEALHMLTSEGVLARENETIKEHGFSLIGRINYQNIVTLLENEFNYKNVLTILLGCPTAFYIETNVFAERIKAILSIWDSNTKNPRLSIEDFLIEDLYDRSELMGDSVLYRVGNTHDDYWNEYIDEWLPLEIQTWTYHYDPDD